MYRESLTKIRNICVVADPNLMGKVGIDVLDRASNLLFEMVSDSDLASLYPNLKIVWNIFITTLLGKLYHKKNVLDLDYSAKLVDVLISNDPLVIGNQYLGLPNRDELCKFLLEIKDQ